MAFLRLMMFVSAGTVLSSCLVTKKKFDELQRKNINTEALLTVATDSIEHLSALVSDFQRELTALKRDTTELGEKLRLTSQRLATLEQDHEQLNTFYKNLLTSSGQMNRDLTQQKEQLLAIQENLEMTRKLNDSLSVSLAERERKVNDLEEVLASKDKAVQDLRAKISNALLGFKDSDITVNVKNGKVYVSLAEQLLFGSGSIAVDSKGVNALQQLAKAVKDQRDVNIVVEGHTDNVPVSKKSQYMQDNWDLSVMRATAITKILTNAGVSSNRITASGRGEFVPLADNNTPESRQKNRRTEIIITPDLDELFKILENN
jgi:chemotaxis protein MotB